MFMGFLEIRCHDDVTKITEALQTPLTTRFYDVDHFESAHCLATPAEAREYLDLLLELAKTFPEDNPRFIRYDGACFAIVARLMSIAGIKLSEYDKQHVLDYTTIKYDSDYLNYACQIRDADLMVDRIGDFWRFVALQEFHLQNAAQLNNQLANLSRLHFAKRLRLALELVRNLDRAENDAAFIFHQYEPRAREAINASYQSEMEHVYPLIFYHHPTKVTEKLFEDQQFERQILSEWQNCELHRKFDDKKLAQLLNLEPGFKTTVNVYHPETGEILFPKYDAKYERRREAILETYPELEPYYYPYIAFDFFDHSAGSSSENLRLIIRDLAGAFDAEAYLPMANYSQRETLLRKQYPKDEMSETELAMAETILEFMENAR